MSETPRDALTGLVITRPGRAERARIASHIQRLGSVCSQVRVVEAETDLRGLVSGLAAAEAGLVAAVTETLEPVDPELFPLLAGCWMGEVAVVPLVGRRVRAFPGVYAASWAPALARQVEEGRRGVIPALSALSARVVGDEVWGDLEELGVSG